MLNLLIFDNLRCKLRYKAKSKLRYKGVVFTKLQPFNNQTFTKLKKSRQMTPSDTKNN